MMRKQRDLLKCYCLIIQGADGNGLVRMIVLYDIKVYIVIRYLEKLGKESKTICRFCS